MLVERNFKIIIPDNDEKYFNLLEGVVQSVDEYGVITINRAPKGYNFRIVPSDATYINNIIKELTKLHNILKIKLLFSKSIKNSACVNFSINII
jgi:hypothetical protein